jgi:type III pantothenate kinase
MSSIYLDIGNSFIKAAQKRDQTWEMIHKEEIGMAENFFKTIAEQGNVETIVTSSVRRDVLDMLNSLLSGVEIKTITTDKIPSEYLDYKTPQTLGIDRFLVCLGAFVQNEGNVIVIDAGSACTIDLMTKDNVFRGGVIMPGLEIFHRSMRKNLPELPGIEREMTGKWPGKSTEECVGWGVNGSYLMAIGSFLNKFKSEYTPAEIFVTGGDATYISSYLNEEIPMKVRDFLLFEGMTAFEEMVGG